MSYKLGIMPVNIQNPPKLSSPTVSAPRVCNRRGFVSIRASTAAPTIEGGGGSDSVAAAERAFSASPSVPLSFTSNTTTTTTTTTTTSSSAATANTTAASIGSSMKGQNYGSLGAVTLEKGKLNNTQKNKTYKGPELETGGGGGDMGKGLFHGGGDGGDDGGDDDDYFDDFDEDDEGDEGGFFRRRKIFGELFDRKFVEAVLNEWQKTMMDLPAGFRQACEMGLVSSAQLVNFFAMNARPTTERFISRALPQGISRAFIGRMLADPAFLYKLLLEQAATVGFAVWWEVKNRKERIKQEWDLALVNILTVSVCNAIVVWSLAPCRSYGNTFRFDLQNTLQKLPNNIFEQSYPLREFDLQKRIQSFIYKAAELCMVGITAGGVQGGLSNLLVSKKKESSRVSMTIPSVSTNALGYGAFIGLYGNLRYQLLCGFDRAMVNYFDVIGVALFFSTAVRILNAQLGERSRLAWLGMEADPLPHSDDLLKPYERPSGTAASSSSPKWFISKNTVVSGLGLLGIKQGDSSSISKPRRKRIVRKKVTTPS